MDSSSLELSREIARGEFVFATCQVGAEVALKAEVATLKPEWRLAFSRPGFLTFKTAGPVDLSESLGAVFARSWGLSLGKVESGGGEGDGVEASSLDALAQKVVRFVDRAAFDRLHVWQRDTAPAGRGAFEPLPTPLAIEAKSAVAAALQAAQPEAGSRGPLSLSLGPATLGERVLDCVIVEPGSWWIGWHSATLDPATCWEGGAPTIEPPSEPISRAYFKMEEALRWSRLPAQAGQRWAEIGCAPGGASQALLQRGMHVLGLDPAEVDPRLAEEPRFKHLRMRAADARRREFRDIRWLAADINVAPEYTLDAVEAIVGHSSVSIEGLLLTLKLLDWRLAAEVPAYLERIRSWGYPRARARQLAFNRQEICVAALREPQRRPSGRSRASKQSSPSRLKPRRKRL